MRWNWTIATLILASPLQAEPAKWAENTLSVQGEGVATLKADIATVELAVEMQGGTAVDVRNRVAKRIEPVLQVLRQQQAENVETGQYSVYPLYGKENNTVTGYRGYQTVSFRAASKVAGELLDQAMHAGANKVQTIQLSATDEQQGAAKEKALVEATHAALRQADIVLNALNLTKKAIVHIEVDPSSQPVFRTMALKSDMRSLDAAATEVTPQEQEVRAQVSLLIGYE